MNTLLRDKLKIQKYTGRVGAVISGVDLATEDRPEIFAAIADALHDSGVIFLRDQMLTPDQYMAFGLQFGPFDDLALDPFPHVPGSPSVKRLIREPDDLTVVGEWWHTDQAFRPKPNRYTALMSVEVPPFGGDTCFMNATVAFETLSEAMKDTLRPLRAVHSLRYGTTKYDNRQHYRPSPDMETIAVHPVVTRHRDTGREILFVNPAFVEKFEGWTEHESRPLLEQLYAHCLLRPEFQCRFMWTPNAIAMWDNSQVWHYAMNDSHGHRREMLRLMID